MIKDSCVTSADIGSKVKTPYGTGVLIDVDAGAGFYVEPLSENEEWECYKFTMSELEHVTN